jgi:hypothetical protein
MRLYPLPTALVMCDTSGWGSFKVTYEGCCVINTGSLLRVDQGDGRGRYTAAWWEWDCGVREGKEIIVGITDRAEKEPAKEKKERKRKVGGENGITGRKVSKVLEDVILENIEMQVEESQVESQIEEVVFGEGVEFDV